MNRELATYILSLNNDISYRIWLSAISRAARNGNVTIKFRDLALENRITQLDLQKYFNPREAQDQEIVRILVETESFITINFRKGSKVKAGTKILKRATDETAMIERVLSKETNLSVVKHEPKTDDKGLLIDIHQINNYAPSYKLIQGIIADYVLFFKAIQSRIQAMAGIVDPEPKKPNLQDKEVAQLKQLAHYFKNFDPRVTTEDQIRRTFQKVYSTWHLLDPWLQNQFEPGALLKQINKIVIAITKINVNGKQLTTSGQNTNGTTKGKREQIIDAKLSGAEQRDYSKLAASRNKST